MKQRIWWLVAAGVLLMGLGLHGAQAAMASGTTDLPDGLDYIEATAGEDGLAGVDWDDLAVAQAQLEGSRISWWALQHGVIGADERNTTADVYAVTGAFQDFHHMDMLYGSFLPRARNGSNAAVLDNALAYRLFGTENAVGLEVQFMGTTFQVCGVYRADDSLLGLMSGNGQYRAYVTGYDLVSTGNPTIGGIEALIPSGAPGETLQALQSALQDQGLPVGLMLFQDRTEQRRVNKETMALPLAALSLAAMAVLLAIVIRSARGIFRESLIIIRQDYLQNVWSALLWRFGKFALVIASAAVMSWIMWRSAGLELYLPAKYIPGSWIDLAFYKELIRSESQAAIEAANYGRQWWAICYETAQAIGRALNAIAMLGAAVTALSLRTLWADRRWAAASRSLGKTPGSWDIPALWGLALLSFALSLLLTAAMGLPLHTGADALTVQGLTLAIWALALHRDTLDRALYQTATMQIETRNHSHESIQNWR